ncbi:hypothetical protein ACEN2P_12470 [Pedobacter psychrotolerans]|uniref:hypothetical protein n=1 Tax=Pedobacter psychrotolerans TaxID=1843235 RepID=UPI003F964BC2
MSMHEIEDLVEETTHLVDQSSDHDLMAKRDILFNLYQFEAFFDTSYTHFRVMDILLKNRFVYRIPVAEYPQLGITEAQLPADEDGDWVCDENQNALAYAQSENGAMYLYVDAGEIFWKRLCELDILPKADQQPPQQFSIPQLVKIVMLEAEKQQQTDVLKEWYNLFANAVLAGDFGASEGISDSFEGILNDPHLSELRAIAVRNQLDRQKVSPASGDYLSFPGVKTNLTGTESLEESYKIRYLLDFSKDTLQLEAAYRKDQGAMEAGPAKTAMILPTIDGYLAPLNWTYVEIAPEKTWRWYQDLEDDQFGGPGHRCFIQLQLDTAENTLFCQLALQHSLILKWQEKQPSLLPENWHFYHELSGWLNDDFTEKNRHLSSWGSWKFDLKQSEKVLKSHLENLIAGLKQNSYFDFVMAEFPEKFLAQDPQRILYLLDEGEDGTGIIPKYVLFDSKVTSLIAFAKWAAEKKDEQQAAKIMDQIMEMATTSEVSALQQEVVIDPLVRVWQENKVIIFPPVWQLYLVKSLREKR